MTTYLLLLWMIVDRGVPTGVLGWLILFSMLIDFLSAYKSFKAGLRQFIEDVKWRKRKQNAMFADSELGKTKSIWHKGDEQ